MASSNPWEELRKQARQLENEIDIKLISFSKLGTGYGNRDYSNSSPDTTPLLNSSNSDHMFETMVLEIEQLISKLTEVNENLLSVNESQSVGGPSPATGHTLQRHREILKDFCIDFQKTKDNIQLRKDREELLGSVRKDIDAYKSSSSGLNRRSEMYFKESEHIKSSDRMVDEQIRIAMKTKDELLIQRSTLKAIQKKVTTLANHFPMISSLISRVNLRKRRDSIILGAVIGVCLILILLYTWH